VPARALLLLVCAAITITAQDTPTTYDDMWPAWSPDGRKIVFVSTRDRDPEIYVMDADGSQARRLTAVPGRDAHPYWSPDGSKIVFQSPRENGHTRIFLMNADGSAQRAITKNEGFCGVPVWSPDGRTIVFQCTSDLARTAADAPWKLFAVAADGGEPRQLTAGPGNDQVPNWAPDGRRLVFYSNRSGIDQLYVMDADGGSATRLTATAWANRAASWSPDGRSLVFHSERHGSPSDIYRMEMGATEPTRLTSSGPGHGVPYFSPDARSIVYQSRSANGQRISLMNADGSNPRQLLQLFDRPRRAQVHPSCAGADGVRRLYPAVLADIDHRHVLRFAALPRHQILSLGGEARELNGDGHGVADADFRHAPDRHLPLPALLRRHGRTIDDVDAGEAGAGTRP
jgi:TolB protein